MPSRSEDQLDVTASVFSEVMNIGGRIVIKWRDNGPAGWPGGLKIPGSVPPGEAHEVEFKRNDLKIPDKLEKARVRLTYLGNDKWRIKLIEE
jgi:hypothetical protein